MKTVFILLTFLTINLSSAQANEFCVQTFNAYGPAYGLKLESRTDHVLKYLSNEYNSCAIIHFQEVWKEKHNDHLVLGISEIFPEMSPVQFDRARDDEKITGLLSFYNGQIIKFGSELFHINKDGLLDDVRDAYGVSKGIGFSFIRLKGMEQKLIALNTHTHPQSVPVRITQMVQIINWLEINNSTLALPIIVTGDFNAIPGSIEWRLLTNVLGLQDGFLKANKSYDGVCTYCHTNPISWSISEDSVFDYVFYKSAKNFRLTAIEGEINLRDDESPMSDHYGIKVKLHGNTENVKSVANCEKKKIVALATLNEAQNILEDSKFSMVSNKIVALKNQLREKNSFLSQSLCLE